MGCGHFTKAKSDLLAAAKKEPRSATLRRMQVALIYGYLWQNGNDLWH